ncbi:alpha/beta hydrolase [Leisingera daeponensis]|uniref:alpha/beta hydrolase n=1 Tax=Leisingera daeponensis TaxID=405746 RepID=UPI001C983F72|nr:alpha/beta hydrolase [Leisingera daeponensis]MBY6057347.1 alpha/beta hydrolase [Leisingera daeponensis]
MRETRVFDGTHLRASLFNPGQPRLFVSFRQRTAEAGQFSRAQAVRTFTRAGFSHLHLQSRLNDWYINHDTAALEAALQAFSAAFDEVAAMGFSMGGYAALRFARALNLSRLVAVSPQISISPEHVPFDRRYRKHADGFDPEQGALAGRGHPVQGAVLADPFRPADLVHAEMIQMVFPGLAIARLAGGGHPATRVLRQGRGFAALQQLLLHGGAAAQGAVALHRPAHRNSPVYWQHLAAQAEKSGRKQLAQQARQRHMQVAVGKAPENAGR